MRTRTTILACILLALLGLTPILQACHTVAGAGQDISSTGRSIEKSADRHTP